MGKSIVELTNESAEECLNFNTLKEFSYCRKNCDVQIIIDDDDEFEIEEDPRATFVHNYLQKEQEILKELNEYIEKNQLDETSAAMAKFDIAHEIVDLFDFENLDTDCEKEMAQSELSDIRFVIVANTPSREVVEMLKDDQNIQIATIARCRIYVNDAWSEANKENNNDMYIESYAQIVR